MLTEFRSASAFSGTFTYDRPSSLEALDSVTRRREVMTGAFGEAAPQSMFPTVFLALGWIALVAAVVLPLIGRARIASLLTWLERTPSLLVRLWLVAGVAFGAFLRYGASVHGARKGLLRDLQGPPRASSSGDADPRPNRTAFSLATGLC